MIPHVPQNSNRAWGQHHRQMEVNGEAEPALYEAAEDEAVCDLRVPFLERVRRREREGGETNDEHVSGHPSFHTRTMDLSYL